MTFHCDKLCSCETCAPLRWALSYVDGFGKPLGSYAAVCHRESAAYLAAWWASRDPAKLAELMASALRARGLNTDLANASWSVMIVMPQAGAKLLAIMQTSPDESSREACEQILKGEP